MVVPMFAPNITPIACCSDSRPALTNPTVMTLVAEELWMSAVTPAPAAIAKNLFFVMYPSTAFSLLPAVSLSPSLISPIP